MTPNAPAATPTSLNSNQPFGGFGEAQADSTTAGNILNYLPTQEAQTTTAATNANTNPASILPNVSINAPVYAAPNAPTINAGSYGNDLTGYNTAVQGAEQGLTSTEGSTYQSALGNLSSAEQQYGNLTPVYQQLAGEYNIPGYQSDIANLSDLLQNLGRDVNAQTTLGGGAITESARDEMYSNESQPLNIALNNAGEFLNYGQQDVSNLLDAYQKSLGNELTPLETNISNLPTLFGQTNEAAEAGYNQGYQSIQDLIQNQVSQQQANAATQQAKTYAQMVQDEYGTGGSSEGNVINSLSSTGNSGQLLPGVTQKNSSIGGASGFNFTVGNKPASAATWAINNASQFGQGTSPAQAVTNMIYSMAAAGNQGANSAYTAIENNNGNITPKIMSQFSDLFWGSPGSGSTPNPAAKPAPAPAPVSASTSFLGLPLGDLDSLFGGFGG